MKRLILLCCALTGPCWSQGKPVSVEVPKPIAVKVETPAPPAWQSTLQSAAAPFIVAVSTLLGVWLTNRNNQRANERHYQREMLGWRADKQLEVLGGIGQLTVQVRSALRKTEEEHERGVGLRAVQALSAEIASADQAARAARQDLMTLQLELAAVVSMARFILPDALWREIQALEEMFVEVRDRPHGGQRRVAQLHQLDAKIESVVAGGRSQIDSLSGLREPAVSPTS